MINTNEAPSFIPILINSVLTIIPLFILFVNIFHFIIGSIFIYKIGDNHYELDTISIHPKYQDAGIGGEAIALIEKIYSDTLVWSLSTPETDYRNRHFYEKIGYIQFDAEVINEHLTLIRYRKEVRLIRAC